MKSKMTIKNTLLKAMPTLMLTSLLSACGGGSDTATDPKPDTGTPITPLITIDDEFGFWLTDLANNHILPSYQNLQDTSALLSSQAVDFCDQQNQSSDELTALQQSWRKVMSSWQTIQWLKVGPIVNDNRIFRMHYWPDSKDSVGRGVTNLLTTSELVTEAFIATQSVGSQGLPALEQLIFADNQHSLLTASDQAKRCEVLTAISANVATISQDVNSEWQIIGGNYHAQLTQGTGDFSSKKDAVEELVTNWLEQIERVKDEKMLVPLSVASPGIPSIAEHVLSDESVISIQKNIATFKVIYSAGGGHGFDDILIDHLSQQNIATEMLTAIDNAIVSANELTGSYETLLKTPEGRVQISATIDVLRAVRDVLTVDFVQATDINIGFNSNDGD
ncbi:imelysin family protein [Colwellia psychrerythraea]|uniref:Peptidase M75, Imelysin n=1 Tax=Colwellia psychrerythraea TaxID=28229 RepID=A0A099KZ75_COLPS|nr:imelysin family protein [Colwellia psychrerythraea]KGJ94953.1 Peptidase M75, Imelysin [Colwellia psychrerythraea]